MRGKCGEYGGNAVTLRGALMVGVSSQKGVEVMCAHSDKHLVLTACWT